MRYWDSSAFVPVLINEPATVQVQGWLRDDPQVTTWWGTELECVSAIARRERDRLLKPGEAEQALRRLTDASGGWLEIQPQGAVRATARRLLRAYPLRAADALQLAAAWLAANQQPTALEFVCLDDRLADAARREGFPVIAG